MKNNKYLRPEMEIELLLKSDILAASEDTSDTSDIDSSSSNNYENAWHVLKDL